MQADLSGMVALVTGSSGDIGKAIALKLAENGADIAINGLSPDRGPMVVEQIKAMGRRAIFERADINNYAEARQMALNTIEKLDKIDILVVSGGARSSGVKLGFFRDVDPENYVVFARSRWLSRANCARAVLDHMIEKQYGKILFVTTDAGRTPTPGEVMNGASGAAVVQMTKAMAKEFTRWKIRVNCLCITVTETESSIERRTGPVAKVMEKAEKTIPFGVNKASDVAEAALYFASRDSDQVTGSIFSINGGLSFPG